MSTHEKVLKALSEAGEYGLTATEVAQAVGRSRQAVHYHFGVLMAQGLARPTPFDRYTCPQARLPGRVWTAVKPLDSP